MAQARCCGVATVSKKTTSERRRDYTPEQLEAERQYRLKRYAENRECILAEKKAERQQNKDSMNAADRAKRAAETPEQRERRLAIKRQRYQDNREAVLAYAREYRKQNAAEIDRKARESESRREYLRNYRKANSERRREYNQAWLAENAEYVKAWRSEYLKRNLDRHRRNQQNRRARKAQNGGKLSAGIVATLMQLQRGKCAACRNALAGDYHIDHIVPLALGGSNADENVQLLHSGCNLRKAARHPVEFMQSLGNLL